MQGEHKKLAEEFSHNPTIKNQQDINRYTLFFKNELLLDNLETTTLENLCDFLGVPRVMLLPPNVLCSMLVHRAQQISLDDTLIEAEAGVDSLSPDEITQTCVDRCISSPSVDALKLWISIAPRVTAPQSSRYVKPSVLEVHNRLRSLPTHEAASALIWTAVVFSPTK